MGKTTDRLKENWGKREGRLRRTLFPVLIFVFVIAVIVSLQLVYGRHPERLIELKNYVYWGAFLISLVGNATIILPGAVLLMLGNMMIVVDPVGGPVGPSMVGLAGGVGAAIGEMTGYMVGYSGRGVVGSSRLYLRLVVWVRRWGIVTIFILSLMPVFFDLVGIIAGAFRFPLWKFVLLCWLGRTILYMGVVLGGVWGWEFVLPYFT